MFLRVPGHTRQGAHPRVSGENTAILPRSTTVRGSSPRERGKRAARPEDDFEARLIPA